MSANPPEKDPTGHGAPQANVAGDSAAMLTDSLRVTREGFEFHVTFRTRFGETKTAKLQDALDLFQNMRVFKPHVSLQKSGIRLVVTCWDGDSFTEQRGIENVEHASPDEVEELIRANLQGAPERSGAGSTIRQRRGKSPVSGLSVIKKPHDARFHLLIRRLDGTTQEGPVLIRSNLAKLSAERLLHPSVTLTMTAMNDRITITRPKLAEGRTVLASETLPLVSDADAKNLEQILQECLPPIDEPVPQPEASDVEPAAAAAADLAAAPVLAPEESTLPEPVPTPAPQPKGPDTASAFQPGIAGRAGDSAPGALAAGHAAVPHRPGEQSAEAWVHQLLAQSAGRPPEQVNEGVFQAVIARFKPVVTVNDHDLPAFTIRSPVPGGAALDLEFVLSPHYLLCAAPFGYVRFGADTRLFSNQLDDYASFPQYALRGALEHGPSGGLRLVLSTECAEYLRRSVERGNASQISELICGLHHVEKTDHLLWPQSEEEHLFDLVAQTAQGYGLPVTPDTVTLDPKSNVFVGFNRTPNGMEFRDGEEFIRFSPTEIHVHEDERDEHRPGTGALCGWALDAQGHLCAVYRPASGFEPPADLKLLHFVPAPVAGDSCTILGMIG